MSLSLNILLPSTSVHVSMQPGVLEYSEFEPPGIRPVFKTARAELKARREMAERNKTLLVGSALEDSIIEAMADVVFASNQIAGIGCGAKETLRICGEVFQGELHYQLEAADPCGEGCVELLEEFLCYSGDKNDEARRAVLYHAAAFNYLLKVFVRDGRPLDGEMMRKAHSILANGDAVKDCCSSEGDDAALHTLAKRTYREVEAYVNGINDKLAEAHTRGFMDPFHFAASAMHAFVILAPFADGNGLVARLLLNILLIKHAGTVAVVGPRDVDVADWCGTKHDGHSDGQAGKLAGWVLTRAVEGLQRLTRQLKLVADSEAGYCFMCPMEYSI